ncbi:hypothetical protein N9C35_04925 [Flavobacteriaceae bacterium]|nr:hypothetical protein [Flavobacteriaceae bacterium]
MKSKEIEEQIKEQIKKEKEEELKRQIEREKANKLFNNGLFFVISAAILPISLLVPPVGIFGAFATGAVTITSSAALAGSALSMAIDYIEPKKKSFLDKVSNVLHTVSRFAFYASVFGPIMGAVSKAFGLETPATETEKPASDEKSTGTEKPASDEKTASDEKIHEQANSHKIYDLSNDDSNIMYKEDGTPYTIEIGNKKYYLDPETAKNYANLLEIDSKGTVVLDDKGLPVKYDDKLLLTSDNQIATYQNKPITIEATAGNADTFSNKEGEEYYFTEIDGKYQLVDTTTSKVVEDVKIPTNISLNEHDSENSGFEGLTRYVGENIDIDGKEYDIIRPPGTNDYGFAINHGGEVNLTTIEDNKAFLLNKEDGS